MNAPTERLMRLIRSLEDHAGSVDATFAVAGRDLGKGLNLFDTLQERLSALSGRLSGDRIITAGAALARLADDLRPLRQTLAEETRSLVDIAVHSAAAGQTWEKLVEHIRLITIIAHYARIESISIQGVGRDFGDFANEIFELTTQAQRTIEACAREHDRMSALLATALASQREFETQYGAALSSLSDKLSLTLAEVEDRQRSGMTLASEAAARSGKIAMAAGMAIVALQSGDSIRQRLEHATAGLHLAETLEDGRPADGLPTEALSHARDLLLRIEAAQLEASAATLGEDAELIEQNLLLLRDETMDLVDLVRSLYGAGGADTGSFMAQLGADLGHASALLGKCNSARAGADQVAQALTALLDTSQQTVDALATTVSNIVLIGTNASLRAARVGSNGRSLVIIAHELKLAADLVASVSSRLPAIFEQMQRAAGELKRQDRLDAAHFGALDREMSTALIVVQETASELALELSRLMREGAAFGKVVDQARLGFSGAAATGEAIGAAAHAVAAMASDKPAVPAEMNELVRGWLNGTVWPHYTMAIERTIHCGVIEPVWDAAAQVSTAEPASDDVDALLF